MSESLPRGFGPYVLRRVLGAGAGGTVYLAEPRGAPEGWPAQLVVKVLRPEIQKDRDHIRRFEHEARIAVRVDHPNVVRVLDAGETQELIYIGMEFVDGFTLSTVRSNLEAGGSLPVDVSLGMIGQLLEGLVALHAVEDDEKQRVDFVHRDLSPRNVMIDATGLVRIIDFGLGKSALQDWKTRPGTTLGSAGYMPPEQVAGDPVDQTADIYAVGAITYELLTGRRMIPSGGALEMLHATLTHLHEPTTTHRSEVPPVVDEVIRRATASLPEQRFGTAREMLDALRATGARVAKRTAIAKAIHERLGPVEPVALEEEAVETSPTSKQQTRVVARREGLVAPAIEALMHQPTRAEIVPPAVAEVAFAPPPVPRSRTPIIALVAAVTMTIVAALALFATFNREQTPPTAYAPMPTDEPPSPTPSASPRPLPAAPPPRVAKKRVRVPPAARPAPPTPRRTSPKQKTIEKTKVTTTQPAPRTMADEIRDLEHRAERILNASSISATGKERALQIVMLATRLEKSDDEAAARRDLAAFRHELDRLR